MAVVNVAYLANTFAIPESNVQSLLDAPTVELAQSFLSHLTTFAQSYHELKSEKLRADIELEAAVRSGETKTRQLKNSLEKSLKETETLRRSLNDAGT
jgi:nucleoprotein TPR